MSLERTFKKNIFHFQLVKFYSKTLRNMVIFYTLILILAIKSWKKLIFLPMLYRYDICERFNKRKCFDRYVNLLESNATLSLAY